MMNVVSKSSEFKAPWVNIVEINKLTVLQKWHTVEHTLLTKMHKGFNFLRAQKLLPVKVNYDENNVKMDLFNWKFILWVAIREGVTN